MTTFKPPLLLRANIVDAYVNGDDSSWYNAPPEDPSSWLNGYPTEWFLKCQIIAPQIHSADGFEYNASNVEVGDWITSLDGKAVQIVELLPLQPGDNSYSDFRCRTRDIDNYLMLSDPSQTGQSIGSLDSIYIFKCDEDGLPIIDYLPAYQMEVTAVTNLMSRFFKQGKTKIWVQKDGSTPIHTHVLDFVGDGWIISDGGDGTTKVEISISGGGGSNITIKDNGTDILVNPTSIDFGTGLDVTVNGTGITIDAAPALNVQKDGSDIGIAQKINFTGDNISVEADTDTINVSVQPIPVKNDGSDVVANPNGLDFSTGFTVTQDGNTAKIDVNTNVVQSKIDVKDDGTDILSNPTTIDFGAGLKVSTVDTGILVDVDNTTVQSTISVKDDGSEIVNNPPTLNFGNGLRVTREGDNDARIDVVIDDIPPSIDIQDDGTSVIASPSTLNFGDGLKVTSEAGGARIELERLEVGFDGSKVGAPKTINFKGGVTVVANGDSVDVSVTGGNKLETPVDGSFTPGAITDWQVGSTTYSTALDDLNEVLAKLLPARPASLSSKALSIKGAYNTRNGVNVLLADSATNNVPGLTPVFGTQTNVVFGATIESNDVVGFGSGNSGTLTARINGLDSGSAILTNGNDTGTYSSLVITSDADYPASTPGFWQALTAKVSAVGVTGINRYELKHTDGGDATPVTFVRDNKNVAPTINGLNVTEGTANVVFSSGVPHYTANSTINLAGSVDNLVGQTYLASKNVVFSTSKNIGNATLSCGQFGLATVPTANLPTFAFTAVPLTLTGTAHTTTTVSAIAANSYADSASLQATKQINYLSGTPFVIIEGLQTNNSVPMKRVAMANGDKPTTTYATFATATWNSGNASSQGDAANAWEAVVRGGVVRNDTTNYADGSWLPVGPNYSAKAADQYICFVIQKVTSSIKITFTGSDPAGLWIKLPDVSTNDSKPMPNATNGWWDAKKQLNFPAGSYPGSSGSHDGCLRAKTGLLYDCSFGVVSSAAATDNQIYIRIKLTAGQSLSNITLSF